MELPKRGDIVVLGSPSMSPKYLNGAEVRIEWDHRTSGGETVYDGTIVAPGPSSNRSYKNRAGYRVRGIRESMIAGVRAEPVAA